MNPVVTVAAHLVVAAPSHRAALVTTLLDGRIGTNGTMNVAKTETTIAGTATMIVVTGTTIVGTVIASAPVTVPAPPTTVIVRPRTTGKDAMTTARDAMMTEIAVTTSVRMSRMAKTGKVCTPFG